MLGDRQNYTRSPCRPATHLLTLVYQLHARHNAFFFKFESEIYVDVHLNSFSNMKNDFEGRVLVITAVI